MLTRTILALALIAGCSAGDGSDGEEETEATTAFDCVPTGGFDESSSTGPLPTADLSKWDGDPERGFYYRRPNEAELESTFLEDDNFLLILPAEAIERFESGDGSVRLPVPIEGEIMTLGLELVGTTGGAPVIERRWTGECFVRETLYPTYFEYQSPGYYFGQEFQYDGEYIVGRALASDLRGSLSVTGGTATQGFSLRGPYASEVLGIAEGLPLARRSVHIITVQPKP